MDAKDMCLEFLSQIKRKKQTQLQFCEENKLDYSSFKALTDKVISCDKDARVGTINRYAKALGLKLILVPDEDSKKKERRKRE